MPGPTCKPVRTILDPRGNVMSITDSRARHAATAYAQHQWPQYSVLPALGISTRRTRLDHDPPGERLTPYNKYFPNELFEGAIRGYLLNVYCRKLCPLFMCQTFNYSVVGKWRYGSHLIPLIKWKLCDICSFFLVTDIQ